MILPITPLSQRDNRWGSQRLGTVNSTTIGSHGCVVTSMCMISTYYGHPITPAQLDDTLTNKNLYYDGNLFINGSITKIFPDIKFDRVAFCETTPAPIADIKKYLDEGKPVVVALINQGIRHYILAVGYEGDRIFANDPWMGDQVAINDRWGDPSAKILQINFFSGPIPDLNVQPDDDSIALNDQTVINLGTQLGFMEVQAVRSQLLDSKRVIQGLETDLQNARTALSQVPNSSTAIVDQTPINLGSTLGSMEVQAIRSEILDLRRVKEGLETDLQNARMRIVQLESTPVQVAPTRNQLFVDSLKSRKFILSVLAAIVAFVNSTFDLGINQDQMLTIISPMLAFIGVEGLADALERGKTVTPVPQSLTRV